MTCSDNKCAVKKHSIICYRLISNASTACNIIDILYQDIMQHSVNWMVGSTLHVEFFMFLFTDLLY